MGRWCVHKNTAGLHAVCKFIQLFLLCYGIEINRRSVTITAVCNQTLCFIQSIGKVLCLIHCQNRRKLFMRKLLGKLYALYLANQNLGVLRHLYLRQGGNGVSTLTYNLSVKRTVD